MANKKLYLLLFSFLLFSCDNVINIKPVGVTFSTGAKLELSDAFSSVIIYFDTSVDREKTENMLEIKSVLGNCDIDKEWENNTLIIKPVKGWERGIIYNISLTGVLCTTDGREERVAYYSSFHYGELSERPFLVTYYPSDGAHAGVDYENGAYIILYFSKSMDTVSVEDAFSINGFSKKEFIWNTEKSILTIKNKDKIAPLETFTWIIKENAKSADGFPLAKSISATWFSDADIIKPEIKSVYTLMPIAGEIIDNWVTVNEWTESEKLDENKKYYKDAIAIEFTKKMDASNLSANIRFEPSLTGKFESIDGKKIVFIPEREPDIGAYYTMTIGADIKDENGIKMAEDKLFRFIYGEKYLEINALIPATFGGEEIKNSIVSITLPNVDAYAALMITFNQGFSSEAKIDCYNAARLQKIFPAESEAPSPVIRNVRWQGDKTLILDWDFIMPNIAHNHEHYYKFTLRGGNAGIKNGAGSYLKNDIVFYIKLIP